ncbi:hypothetical protein GCM10011391_06310 [Pullulanibacillus camelliae]|uniref:Polysaccharide chain length determinant N-terminal domain-containing protein n=2 Tax=Pullulanibacillus camelliae TaxID=1707096 RepID=A0A8J2VLF4_9BACL|nr:hypothetical protein GCM10011391_06310 [Pullulanibacillus camelliae]
MTGLATVYNQWSNPPSLYQSSTRILVGNDFPNINTLMVMIKDPTVLALVSKELGDQQATGDLDSEITTTNIDKSQVVLISVTDHDPQKAARIANIVAKVFKDQATKLLNYDHIQLLSEAKANAKPINPHTHKKIYLGALVGIVIGIGSVFLLRALDDSIQSESELEKVLLAPVLGKISKMTKKNMVNSQRRIGKRKHMLPSAATALHEPANAVAATDEKRGDPLYPMANKRKDLYE